MEARERKDGDLMARDWLVKLREERGYSQAALAKQSGIVQQSYQLIEKGVNTPRPETAMKIGAALGFPWVKFYEEEAGGGREPAEKPERAEQEDEEERRT